MLLTYPGVPSIFAGDEIGLEGSWGEDARRTINWEDRTGWDKDFHTSVKELIGIRRKSHALIEGGLRWVAIEDDFLVYLRESKKETILVFISRKGVSTVIEIGSLGFEVSKTLVGAPASGRRIAINSINATSGVWVLKPIP
jgi:alpha-glucosidase